MQTIVLPPVAQSFKTPWVEVDLGLLEQNISKMKASLNHTTSVIFVVKSNAYGHGLVPIAKSAVHAGIDWLGVAYLEEALELRQSLPQHVHLLVLGAVDAANTPILLDHRIIPVVVSKSHGLDFSHNAVRFDQSLPVHLKIDTGMGRFGIPWEDANHTLSGLLKDPGLKIQGICTHFSSVEPNHPKEAHEQVKRMSQIGAFSKGHLLRHVSNSRAFLNYPQWDFDAVRTGMALYGYGANEAERIQTQPILQWKTHVIQVKSVPANFPVGYYASYRTDTPTDIATVSVGYADGFPRLLGNRGHVLIRGQRCKVIGRVSMNWITVDVGHESGVDAGEEVVLIGKQGSASIWADEIAKKADTIPYEILTRIHPHAPRIYI